MGKNVKTDPERARKNKGVPLLGEVPLLENLRYSHFHEVNWEQKWSQKSMVGPVTRAIEIGGVFCKLK